MNISELLKTPEQNRDFSWDEKFFKTFSEQQVRLLSQDPQQGPDGWPYIICETLSPADGAEAANYEIESTQKLFQWLAEKGIGLVVALLWRGMAYYGYLLLGAIVVPNWIRTHLTTNEKTVADSTPSA